MRTQTQPDARLDVRLSVTDAPEHVYKSYRQAEGLFDEGYPAEAARMLASVVEALPHDVSILELHARALFGSAQLRGAEEALGRLVELRPDDGWARFALARTLERQGRGDEAAPHRRLAAALGVTD
jgi:Flp pilus assembly protein TadD